MRVKFTCHTGYCGMDLEEIVHFDYYISPEELDDYAWDMAVDNAQTYGIDLCDCDDADCELEHIENTNIEVSWEILND